MLEITVCSLSLNSAYILSKGIGTRVFCRRHRENTYLYSKEEEFQTLTSFLFCDFSACLKVVAGTSFQQKVFSHLGHIYTAMAYPHHFSQRFIL